MALTPKKTEARSAGLVRFRDLLEESLKAASEKGLAASLAEGMLSDMWYLDDILMYLGRISFQVSRFPKSL